MTVEPFEEGPIPAGLGTFLEEECLKSALQTRERGIDRCRETLHRGAGGS